MDPALDLDAVGVDPNGPILVSFDTAGTIGGVTFDDDTVLRFTGSAWSIDFDASTLHADFEPADLVAVPEPAAGLQLFFGVLGLAGLAAIKAGGARATLYRDKLAR